VPANGVRPSPVKSGRFTMPLDDHIPRRGLTTREVAKRYRVSNNKIIDWIRNGQMRAINTASVLSAKPRFVIPPEALVEFERSRNAAEPTPPPRRRRKRSYKVDYFPD
jgi:transposase